MGRKAMSGQKGRQMGRKGGKWAERQVNGQKDR